MDITKYIESNPDIMLGKPIIKGTRITVESILRKMADGYSQKEIIAMYPHLKPTHLLAAITYAANVISSEDIIKAA